MPRALTFLLICWGALSLLAVNAEPNLDQQFLEHYRAGRYQQATEVGELLVEQKREKLGPEHTQTVTAMANLAAAYQQCGRLKDAERLQLEALALREKLVGPDHREVATLLVGQLAGRYRAQTEPHWKAASTVQRDWLERLAAEKRRPSWRVPFCSLCRDLCASRRPFFHESLSLFRYG